MDSEIFMANCALVFIATNALFFFVEINHESLKKIKPKWLALSVLVLSGILRLSYVLWITFGAFVIDGFNLFWVLIILFGFQNLLEEEFPRGKEKITKLRIIGETVVLAIIAYKGFADTL